MRESLRFLVGEDVEKRVDIGLAKDGSGVGGTLIMLAEDKSDHCCSRSERIAGPEAIQMSADAGWCLRCLDLGEESNSTESCALSYPLNVSLGLYILASGEQANECML